MAAGEPTLDKETLAELQELFPAAADQLAEMAQLLGRPPTDAALTRFHDLLAEFSTRPPARAATTARAQPGPVGSRGCSPTTPATLFERYRDALRSRAA